MPKCSSAHQKKILKDKTECTEKEFIEIYVFPTLLPAMEKMLWEAKTHKCFEVSFYIKIIF